MCNDDFAPLVKKRIGDYVMSPRFFEEKDFVKEKTITKSGFLSTILPCHKNIETGETVWVGLS